MRLTLAAGIVAAALAWQDAAPLAGFVAGAVVLLAGMSTRSSRRRLAPLLVVAVGFAAVAAAGAGVRL